MVVKMQSEEIVQACKEWALKHHGLELSGQVVCRVGNFRSEGGSYGTAMAISLEWPEAAGKKDLGPYRTPSEGL